MSDPPQAERPEPPYIRLPWPLVAVGLFILIGVIVAIGLYANRNLRPQTVAVATPVMAAPTGTPPPLAAPAPTQLVAPTLPPTPLILITIASPTPTAAPANLAPTQTPPPAAPSTPTELPTVEPSLADEVGKAYVTYWRVRSQALLELDPTHLSDVMYGEYLDSFTVKLEALRDQGRAIKTQVTLNYKVVQANQQMAIVVDRIEDDSFYVLAGSEQSLTDPANDFLRLKVRLRNIDGIWKVVESVSAD